MADNNLLEDNVILGILAGLIGNIPKELIAWAFHFTGYLRYTFMHIAAGAFVSKEFIDDPVSLVIGAISDWIMVGFIGVITVYFIRFTGNRYPVIKSVFVSSLFYIILYGALMALDVTRASLLTPLPNLLLFIPHLALGSGIGLFIKNTQKKTQYPD